MSVSIAGVGLHGGKSVRVVLRARPGHVAIVTEHGAEVPIEGLRLAGTERATTVIAAGARAATVEHLFAACAGLGIHEGLSIEVLGDELPLLDGGATRWCEALASLGIAPTRAPLEVVSDGVVVVGRSSYTFARAPGVRRVVVHVDYDDARVAPDAHWDGDPADFCARIAPARTFAFAHELGLLAHANLASHVTPESVVVLADDAVHCAGRPYDSTEPARHKLLDLLGDLFLYGGPPWGRVAASRPGHAATHQAMRVALQRGHVERGPSSPAAAHPR